MTQDCTHIGKWRQINNEGDPDVFVCSDCGAVSIPPLRRALEAKLDLYDENKELKKEIESLKEQLEIEQNQILLALEERENIKIDFPEVYEEIMSGEWPNREEEPRYDP